MSVILPAQRIIELRKQLTEHSLRYYVSNSPIISDAEYDALFDELLELEKEHPELADPNSPSKRIGAVNPLALKTVKHSARMLSLDKVTRLDQTLQFFDQFKGQEVTLEMKIDGISMHLRYEKGKLVQAATRGNGTEGQDVTLNARTVRTIPLELRKPVTIDVRGEVYWRLSAFRAFNENRPKGEQYANPRNGASGLMQTKDARDTSAARLDFVAYSVSSGLPDQVKTQEALLEFLESLGFKSTMTLDVTRDMHGLPYYSTAIERESLEMAIAFMDDYRKALDLDSDGLVIKLSSLELQRDLGEGERTPRWGCAYKFPPEVKETRLNGVTIQIGKTGQITPVGQIDPVTLSGATVTTVSLCNQDELDRLGVDVGDFVLVQRSGEVIPKIVKMSRPASTKTDLNKSFRLPKKCPCCATPLARRREEDVHLYCPNRDCYDQLFARLVYATGKEALDIDGCGEVSIRMLMDKASVRQLSDLFRLPDFSLFKAAQRKRLESNVEKAKSAPFWRKLAAMNIEGVGTTNAKNLASKYTSLIGIYDGNRLDTPGIYEDSENVEKLVGKVVGANIRKWVDENFDEIERLAECGFALAGDPNSTGPLSGKAFVITGNLRGGLTRNGLTELIESKGGTVKGSVTKHVNYVIKGEDGGGAAKAKGAQKWGTAIITEQDVYEMMGVPMGVKTAKITDLEEDI